MRQNPPIELLDECFKYFPTIGVLYWRERPENHFKSRRTCEMWNSRYAGTAVSCADAGGRIAVSINNKMFSAARVAYAMFHRELPKGNIHYRDGNTRNLAIDNLYTSDDKATPIHMEPIPKNSGCAVCRRVGEHKILQGFM